MQRGYTKEFLGECVHRVDGAAVVKSVQIDSVVLRIGIDSMRLKPIKSPGLVGRHSKGPGSAINDYDLGSRFVGIHFTDDGGFGTHHVYEIFLEGLKRYLERAGLFVREHDSQLTALEKYRRGLTCVHRRCQQ